MKKFVLAAASLVALSANAQAADLMRQRTSIPSAVLAPAPTVMPWTGFYVGAQIGYGFGGRFDTNTPAFGAAAPFSRNIGQPAGIFGGVVGGYDWQVNNFVFGLAADMSVGDIRRRIIAGGLIGTPSVTGQLQWEGTVRARAGVLVAPDLLLYATGGLAFGQARVTVPAAPLAQSNTHVGWTAGAGGEYRFSPNVSTFVEYRYTDLGRRNFFGIAPSLQAGYEGHSVRLGLNYRFATGGSVVSARY